MNILKKILPFLVIFIMVTVGTVLSFIPFYNRTPYRIGIGVILAIILYFGLLKGLVWRRKNK
ncbi:MAG TPA: hypothetical protein DER70_15865 [Lentisphaeria bacterium]|nr:hypothetical protein [Lentisphaeria bacterium]